MNSRKKNSNSRIYFLIFIFLILGLVITSRLFLIQVRDRDHYKSLASKQHIKTGILEAKRGKIFFSDEINILAENKGTATINIAPREVQDAKELAKILAPIVKIKEKEVLEKIFSKNDPWIILKKNVSIEKTEKLRGISGVYLEPNFTRYYSQKKMCSHALGFFGYSKNGEKRIGQYGIEGYWNKELEGKEGYWEGVVDASGNKILSPFNKIEEPVDGDYLVSTIDSNIQFFVEKELESLFEKYSPENGTIIVADPKTGEILAMASKPNFDPNNYQKENDINIFKNPAVSVSFEPGSIFKPIVMAGALEDGVLSPKTTYVDKGSSVIGNYVIKNSDLKSHGKKTMTEVLELSLNTGMVFVSQKLGSKNLIKYVQKFGFGEETKIDLYGEALGNINNILNPLSNEKKIEYANASFGQGISATPVQMVSAFSTIANQGEPIMPHIIKKQIHPDESEKEIEGEKRKRVISAETASKLTAMLVSVVKNGYGSKAGVDGYLIAGKTGTAQVPNLEKGGYFKNKYIHSFIGYAPAFNPEFLILLKIDHPKGIRFSSDSLAPSFSNIAKYLFSYFGIPPEEK